MLGVHSDQFHVGTILPRQVMDCRIHVIGKAIRPLLQNFSHMYNAYP